MTRSHGQRLWAHAPASLGARTPLLRPLSSPASPLPSHSLTTPSVPLIGPKTELKHILNSCVYRMKCVLSSCRKCCVEDLYLFENKSLVAPNLRLD